MKTAHFLIFLANVIVFVLEYTTGMLGAWFNLGCAIVMIISQHRTDPRIAA